MTRTDASHRFSARSGAALLTATLPLGRAALSCGLAGALTVGAAAAAFAGERPSEAAGARGDQRAVGQEHQTESGQQDRQTASGSQDPGPAQPASHEAPAQRPVTPGRTAPRKDAADQPANGRPGSQDPAGNNGTIKVDGAQWDARVDNEPHPGCSFRVTLFGFDEGQTADITVTGIAPTGGGVLLHQTAVPVSDDAAGGAARDADGATRIYTADDLGLAAVTPNPQQGYHLKVAVDSVEAPGGAKQKVLWLKPCEGQAPVTQPETQPETQPGTGGPAEAPQGPSAPTAGAKPEAPAVAELPGLSDAGAQPASPSEAAYVESSTTADLRVATAGERSTPVKARPTAQASALPTGLALTGAGGLGLLALTGAGAAAAGLGLQVARRRTAAQGS